MLKWIQNEVANSDGNPLRIALGALGTGNENLVMTPTVRMLDLEGVPLGIGLQLGLDQIGLTHHVKDGVLVIHHVESDDEAWIAMAHDAYLIVGHCVLSLIAAGIAFAVAILVCKQNRGGATVPTV